MYKHNTIRYVIRKQLTVEGIIFLLNFIVINTFLGSHDGSGHILEFEKGFWNVRCFLNATYFRTTLGLILSKCPHSRTFNANIFYFIFIIFIIFLKCFKTRCYSQFITFRNILFCILFNAAIQCCWTIAHEYLMPTKDPYAVTNPEEEPLWITYNQW